MSTLGPFTSLSYSSSVSFQVATPGRNSQEKTTMKKLLQNVWMNDEGEDIAEYAVMLAVILVIVVGTIRLIGSQANNVFSETASAMGS
jgi:Flp pilus assembly pilin Flp